MRINDGTGVLPVACEPAPLRINNKGMIYGIILIPVRDPNASKFRVRAGSGMKALRKYP